jgi:hypothetical protein
MLISASIPNLINGVSQQPPSLRLKTQATLQENGLSSVVNGLSKRPCSQHIADLGAIPDTDTAFIHTIRRDQNEYYTLVISTGETPIRVFDKYGVERDVTIESDYLDNLTAPRDDLAATTVADYTFILNKNVVVAEGAETSPARNPEALVYVKQADYSVTYKLSITKNGTTYSREITTMASTQDSTDQTQQAEKSVQTDRIAKNLIIENDTNEVYFPGNTPEPTADGNIADFTPAPSTGVNVPGISFTLYGNVIHIESTDGEDFDVETEDSRGDTFLFAFKQTTGDFKKLPPTGPNGFVMGVLGDNNKGQDDYYVKLIKDSTGQEVWKETVKPGIPIDIDAATMPHQLISNADGTFTFKQASFKTRRVGDDETNPYPSFIDYKLSDIFFHRNRLGLLADENIILSEAGEFEEFNFFKRTVLTLLDSDPIDLAVSNDKVSILKYAVPFNESLLLFSDLTQFNLTAQDLLTPDTVAVNVTTQFEASLETSPVGAGRYVFFATNRGKWSGVREYYVDNTANVDDASDITAHIPNYLPGVIDKMEASSNEDMLLVHCKDDPNAIYVYRYYWKDTDKLQSSWSRWTFNGKVLNFSFNKSDIDILVSYDNEDGTTTVSLERINISQDDAVRITEKSHPVHLDRRRIWDYQNPLETLVKATAEPETVFVNDKGVTLSQEKAQDYVDNGGVVFVGTPYTFRYVFSEQVVSMNKEPITTGRLQLRNMSIVYAETGAFETITSASRRDPSIAKFTGRKLGSSKNIIGSVGIESGKFRFPILSKSDEVTIELVSDSYLPCAFQSAEWEGFFVLRSRKM